jgi:hypothetical protein
MALKRGRLDPKLEMAEDEDTTEEHGTGHPAGAVQVAASGEAYMVSAFRWSDGKSGVSVRVWSEPRPGETLEDVSKRANRFMARKIREAEDALAKVED